MSRTRLDKFNPKLGLDRGRSKFVEASWYVLKRIFFISSIPWPYSLKVNLLRIFGAKAGHGIVIKPRVNIHFPWKLVLGDHIWIGEEVFILNLEPVIICSHTCISQRVFLCTGNHNFRDPCFGYRNSPIYIGSGAWVGACSIVCPGVTIGQDAVVSVAAVVTSNISKNNIVAGNPAMVQGIRWLDESKSEQKKFST